MVDDNIMVIITPPQPNYMMLAATHGSGPLLGTRISSLPILPVTTGDTTKVSTTHTPLVISPSFLRSGPLARLGGKSRTRRS